MECSRSHGGLLDENVVYVHLLQVDVDGQRLVSVTEDDLSWVFELDTVRRRFR